MPSSVLFAADPFHADIVWYATPTAIKQRIAPTGLGQALYVGR